MKTLTRQHVALRQAATLDTNSRKRAADMEKLRFPRPMTKEEFRDAVMRERGIIHD